MTQYKLTQVYMNILPSIYFLNTGDPGLCDND